MLEVVGGERCFWYRVLVARYGKEAERLVVRGRSVSCWWREIAMIHDGVGVDGGGWFDECVSRKVGDGVDTYFWHDRWLGGVPFSVRFRQLFDLVVDKSCSVSTMFSLGWEDGARLGGGRDDCGCGRRSY